MKNTFYLAIAISGLMLFSCADEKKDKVEQPEVVVEKAAEFNYNVDQFADLKILRYKVPGWDNLTLKEQKLVYYLTQAGLSGRDIMWDQNYRHNLTIRKALSRCTLHTRETNLLKIGMLSSYI